MCITTPNESSSFGHLPKVLRDLLYDAIWVKGTLHAVEYKHFEGVASSYHIASVDILEYDFDVVKNIDIMGIELAVLINTVFGFRLNT